MVSVTYRAAKRHVRQSQKAWKFIFDANHTSLADLNRTAVEDGVRKVSYGLMFREWERYASVFSALGIGAENHSRVGVLGSTCAEVIFAFYGLNMVGADVSLIPSYAALQPRKLLHTIREEHLTDFIVADDFAQADLIGDLFAQRKKLGLRKIILLHVPVAGVTVHPALSAAQEVKYLQLQFLYRSACMDLEDLDLAREPDESPFPFRQDTALKDDLKIALVDAVAGYLKAMK